MRKILEKKKEKFIPAWHIARCTLGMCYNLSHCTWHQLCRWYLVSRHLRDTEINCSKIENDTSVIFSFWTMINLKFSWTSRDMKAFFMKNRHLHFSILFPFVLLAVVNWCQRWYHLVCWVRAREAEMILQWTLVSLSYSFLQHFGRYFHYLKCLQLFSAKLRMWRWAFE